MGQSKVDNLVPFKKLDAFKDSLQVEHIDWKMIQTIFNDSIVLAEGETAKGKLQILINNWNQAKIGKNNSTTIDAIFSNIKSSLPETFKDDSTTDLIAAKLSWGTKWRDSINDNNFKQYKSHLVYEGARDVLKNLTLKHKDVVPPPSEINLYDLALIGLLALVLAFGTFLIYKQFKKKKKNIENQPNLGIGMNPPFDSNEFENKINNIQTKMNNLKPENITGFDDYVNNLVQNKLLELKLLNTNSEKPSTIKNAEKQVVASKIWYAEVPINNVFQEHLIKEDMILRQTFYSIEERKNIGIVDLLRDDDTLNIVCGNAENYLQACDLKGTGSIKKDKINKITQGEAVRDGNSWKITKKIVIEYS